jgi:hypothetical protein
MKMPKVFQISDLYDMSRPLNWRDRLHLAADPLTNDLGEISPEDAAEALEYIESLETRRT